MYYPPPGTYIAALGIIAFFVVFWPPNNRWLKATFLGVSLLLTGLEIHNLYRDRNQRDKEQARVRKEEREAFQSIADNITTSLTENQQAFDATMERMGGLAALAKDNINEATGGDSFCFVEMVPVPEGLMAHLIQKGKHPLFEVRLNISDLNALDSGIKSGAPSLLANTRSFSTIDFLAPGLLHPLGVYRIEPKEEYVRYNIFIYARNGSFIELLRLKRLANQSGWVSALLVTASYTRKKKGVVLENIDRRFPMELLKSDQDWNNLKKGKTIKIAE